MRCPPADSPAKNISLSMGMRKGREGGGGRGVSEVLYFFGIGKERRWEGEGRREEDKLGKFSRTYLYATAASSRGVGKGVPGQSL